MAKDVVVVFTHRWVEELSEEGGSQAWSLKPENARKCRLIVCTRNRYHEGAGPEEHQSAFLIGRVTSVEESPERSDRFIVRFDRYALVSVPNVWPGHHNPVWYVNSLADLGIDEDRLKWIELAHKGRRSVSPTSAGETFKRLTIEEAKSALAATFGVKPSQIEIVIKA